MSFGYIQNVNMDKIGDAKNPMLVYYNFDIINAKTIDEGLVNDPNTVFNETRDQPIINDCSKYYFSIVRFTMNGTGRDIPLFIPRIRIGQANPDLTVYSVGFSLTVEDTINGSQEVNTFKVNKFIEFSPQLLSSVRPLQPPLTTQDVANPYYYVFTYEHWVNLVNQTYVELFNDLQILYDAWRGSFVPAPPQRDLITKPPFMKYHPESGLFSIFYDSYGFGGPDSASINLTDEKEQFTPFMNSNMWGLFGSFPAQYTGGDVATTNVVGENNWSILLIVKNELDTNKYTRPAPSSTVYYEMKQDFVSTGSLWSPVASIVFVSNLIPVLNEGTAQPIRYGEGNVLNSTSSSSAFQPIITDISLPLDRANDYNNFVSYVPTAEYRLSSMSNSPLDVRNIDVQIYWKNRLDGQLYPLKLFNLSSVSVKILFRRRDYQS
jgi:hypothetical protein